jgi:hypothetical protein
MDPGRRKARSVYGSAGLVLLAGAFYLTHLTVARVQRSPGGRNLVLAESLERANAELRALESEVRVLRELSRDSSGEATGDVRGALPQDSSPPPTHSPCFTLSPSAAGLSGAAAVCPRASLRALALNSRLESGTPVALAFLSLEYQRRADRVAEPHRSHRHPRPASPSARASDPVRPVTSRIDNSDSAWLAELAESEQADEWQPLRRAQRARRARRARRASGSQVGLAPSPPGRATAPVLAPLPWAAGAGTGNSASHAGGGAGGGASGGASRAVGGLGFSDAAHFETRRAQRVLAAAAGLDGFIHRHYWVQRDGYRSYGAAAGASCRPPAARPPPHAANAAAAGGGGSGGGSTTAGAAAAAVAAAEEEAATATAAAHLEALHRPLRQVRPPRHRMQRLNARD